MEILELGNSKEKIRTLETLYNTDNPKILEKIILTLDDEDIEVRGEAYSSLLLNKNEILNFLIDGLDTTSKNMKSSILLILANRNETSIIPKIIKFVKDEHSIVRSCALGALGHLKIQVDRNILLDALSDSNTEVKKSALQAIIDLKIIVTESKIKENFKKKDSEIEKMISLLKK